MSKHPSFTTEDHTFPASDGEASLFVRTYSKGEPKLHFLVVHGALEHSGRHADLIQFLLRAYPHVAVTSFDHCGHGKSGGTRAYVESFKVYVDDLMKVAAFVAPKFGAEVKNFICAHSLGGLITLTRVLDSSSPYPYPLEGLIFSSPCIRPLTILEPVAWPLLQRLNKLTPKLHLPMIYNGSDLTRDKEKANDFDTDPLIPKFITVRMAKEIFDACEKIRGLSYYLRIPSLFLVSGADKVVDPVSTVLFAHGIDKQLVEVIQYPQHHHDLWNEIDREEIFKTMKKWIDRKKERP
jgi:alpha-beta hydrolase superfamily lysophospholipase